MTAIANAVSNLVTMVPIANHESPAVLEQKILDVINQSSKRPRGRPKGSKNKPKYQ